jgi:hypothetical protein
VTQKKAGKIPLFCHASGKLTRFTFAEQIAVAAAAIRHGLHGCQRQHGSASSVHISDAWMV